MYTATYRLVNSCYGIVSNINITHLIDDPQAFPGVSYSTHIACNPTITHTWTHIIIQIVMCILKLC